MTVASTNVFWCSDDFSGWSPAANLEGRFGELKVLPMTELIRSMIRFSWAISLFGVKQLGNLFSPSDGLSSIDKTSTAFQFVAGAVEEHLGGDVNSTFKAGDRLQRTIVDAIFNLLPSIPGQRPTNGSRGRQEGDHPQSSTSIAATTSPTRQVQSGRLNTTSFVVMGEGLAAGMGDFALTSETQIWSFPAQMAKQMQAKFVQPLLQPPGLRSLAGYADLPVLIPAPLQTTVLEQLPPVPVSNLSTPRLTLFDALDLRPVEPLIHRADTKQTAVNLVWGILPIAQGMPNPLPTQLEYALQQSPTFAVLELGYSEALEAAVRGNPDLLPEAGWFCSKYAEVITSLRDAGSEVLVLTIPNPLDTAYFSTLETASKILKAESAFLLDTYGLRRNDFLTANGLNEISFQMFSNAINDLPEGSVLREETASEISNKLYELNSKLSTIAQEKHALVYDLQRLFNTLSHEGISVGSRRLTGEYLGGFYSLNGYYPGQAGQAIIANEILNLLNREYGADFPLIDPSDVMLSDPVAAYQQAQGPSWTASDLLQRASQSGPPSSASIDISDQPSALRLDDVWRPLEPPDTAPAKPLQLPPEMDQVLPLSKTSSYFGDGISALNCRDEKEIQWGSCGNPLFGGLAMVDSHLSGSIRIKFSPPANNLTHFEISFMGGFAGDDSVLVAPQFFKMGFKRNRVDEVPGTVSSGTLNLVTGEVTDLTLYARYSSTALLALVSVNPTFPKQPLNFPGKYGSAYARFEQRSDGKLDFTFYGSTFVPLGKDIVWPLNFAGPSMQFATIPANGTVMHPHLQLSTKDSEAAEVLGGHLDIPFNSIQELTLYTHNSSFGDAFHLNVPTMGGAAKGRSELLGRLQVQFGGKTGNSVPIAVWALPPAGIMSALAESPVTEVFPGRLSGGPQGFNENLRFPQRTYPLDDLAILDDPFDISVGAIDLRTGRSINELLHRAFISQDLIFALLRVEPRTPKDSFYFRGPALLRRADDGHMVFRFRGIVRIPYPEGFKFPHPDFATGFTVGPNSYLDPFLWFHAVGDARGADFVKQGSASRVRASTGDEFSYSYVIPADPTRQQALFEYENHTQKGRFQLHSLAWVGFSHSGTSQSHDGPYDTVTFTGFGIWSKDGVRTLQQAAAQISTSPEKPYVGIQIASGDISNVNTKPEEEQDALP
jgi:hypothetical protein